MLKTKDIVQAVFNKCGVQDQVKYVLFYEIATSSY